MGVAPSPRVGDVPPDARSEPPSRWVEPDWASIAESIPHLVWVIGRNGRTLYFNRQTADYTGAGADTVTWSDLIHTEDFDRAVASWRDTLRTGTIIEVDVRLRRHDGAYRWHALRAHPIVDPAGRIRRWFGTATDVDGRKQLEEQLVVAQRETAEAMTLLATLQATAPVGLGFVDRELTVVRLNDELATFAGLPRDEQIGRTVAEVAPELWGQLEPIYRHVLDAGGSVRSLPLTSDGAEGAHAQREWLVNFYPVRIDDEIVGVGIVAADVTDRVRAERFRSTVMSQVADGVYTEDREGRLTYMNRAASKMLGWTEDELSGQHMHDVVHFQRLDGTPVSRSECALLTEGTDHRLVRVSGEAFTRKDGSIFPVAYSSMPLGAGPFVDGVSVVFRDVSDPRSSTNLIRVLVADADPASTDELSAMLTRHEGLEVVGVATTTASTVELAQRHRPDVVIIDAGLPEIGGAATTLRIKAEAPATNVILLALDHDEALAAGAIAAGCSGVVDKRRTWVELASAVRAAYYGETTISQAELQQVVTKVRDSWQPGRAQDLTPREREVLLCLTQGLSNRQAATRLGVTLNTVRNHVQRILYKLNVHSRLEAVVLATRDGMLDEPV
jgi:PAS domain S-box-containing protein